MASPAAELRQPMSPPSDRKRSNVLTTVPPRTSSQHQNASGPPSGSRRTGTTSPRRGADAAAGNPDSNNMDHMIATANSRRRTTGGGAHVGPEQAQWSNSSSSSREKRGQSTSVPIRSSAQPQGVPQQGYASNSGSSSRNPSREASEILHSVMISSSADDIERAKQREAMGSAREVDTASPLIASPGERGPQVEESRRGGRSRHDHSKREKHIKFGDYILGNTIGEGEFGKVKLGWKQEGGVQVAIKLIKKDQIGSNPTRMAKIMREVSILKQLTHPNIVRLHKMEESERHFGIVLEYASGGELFDYILNHRYLKDNTARRLFAQLVSGVGYLHKKGIVHRDLKLENLLLDRNRNIIITDFGFANTFDPNDELSEDEELNLADRDFVKRAGLDKMKSSGARRGDLMQTSCGSPCYAAPELVVSDSLYTGRKVDVWSCGVILYAMLAGYLPFDDDPANPEGDNINLLYKYIVNTPLTFPEYVTPHARDLLRRILVPNPRQRADLFEVARHTWLSEYASVVEVVTSSTTTAGEIQNTTVPAEDVEASASALGRSASVRESSRKTSATPPIGGLISKQGTIDVDADAAVVAKEKRDNKRRTVQVEYVAPNTITQRGEASATAKAPDRSSGQAVAPAVDAARGSSSREKPLPRDPPVGKDTQTRAPAPARKPPSSHRNAGTAGHGPARPNRDARAISDTPLPGAAAGRPITGGSMQSTGSRAVGTRASYGQPVPPELADTNVQGRIQQPSRSGTAGSSTKPFGIPSSVSHQLQSQQTSDPYGRPSTGLSPGLVRVAGYPGTADQNAGGDGNGKSDTKGHRRSSTMGEIGGKLFGKGGVLFGGGSRNSTRNSNRSSKYGQQQMMSDNDAAAAAAAANKESRKYPPISMNNSILMATAGEDNGDRGPRSARPSMDSKRSRRSFSLGLGGLSLTKKRSGSISGSQTSQDNMRQQSTPTRNRRFSIIPPSFSLKAIGFGGGSSHKGHETPRSAPRTPQRLSESPFQQPDSQPEFHIQQPAAGYDQRPDQRDEMEAATVDASMMDRMYAQLQAPDKQAYRQSQQSQQRNSPPVYAAVAQQVGTGDKLSGTVPRPPDSAGYPQQSETPSALAPHQIDGTYNSSGRDSRATSRSYAGGNGGNRSSLLVQSTRRFDSPYADQYHPDHSGTSGPAKKVMDFFRRRGKARGVESN